MQCPVCGSSNPAQSRFCMSCGHFLINGQVCQTCYTLLPPTAQYCYHCGAIQVIAGMKCSHCGANIPTNQAFCGVCGTQLSNLTIPAGGVALEPTLSQIKAPRPPINSPLQPQITQTPEIAVVKINQIPPARPISEMLPALKRFLPSTTYEPLERRPTDKQIIVVRDHLSSLLNTTKTYLPQQVILSPQPAGVPNGNMYRGVFIFGDVSGFTPLSEKLKTLGQEGAEKIAEIINSLFTDLVSVLFQYGGNLLKFGGDAMLGLFSAETDEEMKQAAFKAAQTAIDIQKAMEKFSAIEAAGEIRSLKIKIGISAGSYFAAHIGTKPEPQKGIFGTMSFVTTGHTVNAAEQTQDHAEAGQITINQAVYDLISSGIQVSQVEKEPEEGFYRLISSVQIEKETGKTLIAEPPEGDPLAQITYLVDRLTLLTPYLSTELIARIVHNPGDPRISPDHRPVTVMFANYLGISDLIDALGEKSPQTVTEHLNNYFVSMAEVVEQYEGTVARMDQYAIGDRLVIFFGAPRAHEDDPLRSVYTAIAMQEAVKKKFSALQTPQGIFRFRQRIGINTGSLFAGNAGAPDLRQEYTLMGDDINMAARLMSKSGWQEIFISKKTKERVAAFVEVKDRGELKVKGKEILIPTFEVLGKRREIGSERGITGITSPLIGRDEIAQKIQININNLISGRGQILSIIAGSGLGKTRLMKEVHTSFFSSEENRKKVTWIHGIPLSFSEQISYWLAAQIVRSTLDLKSDSTEEDILFSLWDMGEKVLGKEIAQESVPFLAHMMNLELKGEWGQMVNGLDPKVRQKQTFWAAREYFSALAKQRPLVIHIDDLHFSDEASLAFLEDLIQITTDVPVMFCFSFRGLREKGCWRMRDKVEGTYPNFYTEIQLSPLSLAQTIELLSKLLPGAVFSKDHQQMIFEKTSGNPFYIEEVVRSLIENGGVVKDSEGERWTSTEKMTAIDVPDTLQGAIVSRIDRLTEDARSILQMAAVIGRRFQREILTSLSKGDLEIGALLAQLERNDMIRPSGEASEAAYIFPDALVHEVAYDNLLLQRRQEFHKSTGMALEDLLVRETIDPNNALQKECELLAYHYGLSNDANKAIHYLFMAGQKAQAEFANETAIRHFSEILSLLGESEDTWKDRFDILFRRQQVYGLLGKVNERQADLQIMLDLAQEHQDDALLSDALIGMADMNQWASKYEEAKKAAQDALEIKRKLEDHTGQAKALNTLAILAYYQGNYQEAKPLLEAVISLYQSNNDLEGVAWAVMYLGMIYFMQGDYSLAAKTHQRAYDIAQNRQDMFQMGIHLTNLARVSISLGEYEKGLEILQKSLEMKTRVGDRMGQGFNLYSMGMIYYFLDNYEQSNSVLQKSLQLRQQIKDERGISYCLNGLGMLNLSNKKYLEAEDYFTKSLEMRYRLGLKSESIESTSFLGLTQCTLGDLSTGLATSDQAVSLLEKQGTMPDAQQILFNHYQVLILTNNTQAVEYLKKAFSTLMLQSEKITDPQVQKSFLQNVKINKQIITELKEQKITDVSTPL